MAGFNFTRPAAQRIADAVRAYEAGNRDGSPFDLGRRLQAVGSAGVRVRLGKTVDAIERESVGNVTIYTEDEDLQKCLPGCRTAEFTAESETVCAQNLIEDIPADSWVYLLKPQGSTSWHIIGCAVPEEEDSCGQQTINAVTLEFEACHGSGAKAHATVEGTCPGPISGVVVDAPGEGYAILGRVEPELTISGGGGSGATFTVTYTENTDECDIPTWSIASVAVEGGTDYTDDAELTITLESGTTPLQCALLKVTAGSEGVPESVTVEEAGEYYKEDPNAEPYVADVTVTVSQVSPSAGGGATFTVTVDDDPESATFGQITGVTVDDAGDDYIGQLKGSTSLWNGLDFTTIPGYNGSQIQMLGHSGGCLAWYSVTTCEESTSGVCCDGGTISEELTEEECQNASKTWVPGVGPDSLPGPCCDVGG